MSKYKAFKSELQVVTEIPIDAVICHVDSSTFSKFSINLVFQYTSSIECQLQIQLLRVKTIERGYNVITVYDQDINVRDVDTNRSFSDNIIDLAEPGTYKYVLQLISPDGLVHVINCDINIDSIEEDLMAELITNGGDLVSTSRGVIEQSTTNSAISIPTNSDMSVIHTLQYMPTSMGFPVSFSVDCTFINCTSRDKNLKIWIEVEKSSGTSVEWKTPDVAPFYVVRANDRRVFNCTISYTIRSIMIHRFNVKCSAKDS